jgi:hypothetical protein
MLCITTYDPLMKRWIDFVEIKFHSRENIEWHCMQLESNQIQILKLNSNSIREK